MEKSARVSYMFIMVAERLVNDTGAEYLKEVIANWLQKIYDDTVGMTDKETIPLKNVGELRELEFEKNEDHHEGAVCNVGTATDELTNVIAELGEAICRTHENAVVEMDGEVVAVASVQDAEKGVTLKEGCNRGKSECLSTRERQHRIFQTLQPSLPGNRVKLESRSGDIEGLPGGSKASLDDFEGRSRIVVIGEREEIRETERRVRGKMGLG